MADIGVVVAQLVGLLGDGLGNLSLAVADVDAVEAGEAVEAALAVAVFDIDAAAAGDDPGRRFTARMLGHVG